MRLLSIRLIVSLILGITLVSSGFSYYEVLAKKRSLRNDLEGTAEVLGESLVGNVERAWNNGSPKDLQKDLQKVLVRFGNREHLLGVAVYNRQGGLVAITPALAKTLTVSPPTISQAINDSRERAAYDRLGDLPIHILAVPVRRQDEIVGGLAIVHDVSYIRAQSLQVWRETFI